MTQDKHQDTAQNSLIIPAIVPIGKHEIAGVAQDCVDARELFCYLKQTQDTDHFARWITTAIRDCEFIEGEDYELLLPTSRKQKLSFAHQLGVQNSENRGGHNRQDYLLTLDMAKALAMMERNSIGNRTRKYFIACEKELRGLKGDLALFSGLTKSLAAAIRTAKKLGYSGGNELLQAIRAVKTETGVDCQVLFPGVTGLLEDKLHAFTLSKIAGILNITSAMTRYILLDMGIIQSIQVSARVFKMAPGIYRHRDQYIASYEKATHAIKFTVKAALLVEIYSKYHGSVWDAKSGQINASFANENYKHIGGAAGILSRSKVMSYIASFGPDNKTPGIRT